jgi:hypothetical protein
MNPPPPTSSRRGVSLLHVLAAIALISAAMTVALHLLRQATDIMRLSRQADDRADRVQSIHDALRADMWNSYECVAPDPASALIKQAGDRSILWRQRADESGRWLERLAFTGPQPDEPRRWPIPDMQVVWEADGAVLSATFYAQGAARPLELRVVSQLQLAGSKP